MATTQPTESTALTAKFLAECHAQVPHHGYGYEQYENICQNREVSSDERKGGHVVALIIRVDNLAVYSLVRVVVVPVHMDRQTLCQSGEGDGYHMAHVEPPEAMQTPINQSSLVAQSYQKD